MPALSAAPAGISDRVAALRSLACIRARCGVILEAAKSDSLSHFRVNLAKMDDVVTFVQGLMHRDYASYDDVPYHSRWRHFEAGAVDRTAGLKERWESSKDCGGLEQARRLVDLVTTSVLLDAGAGDLWKYKEAGTGYEVGRSEGLGVASFHMFDEGAFSSDPGNSPHRADSTGLKGLADDSVRRAFQVDDAANPLVGCDGRTQVRVSAYGSMDYLLCEYSSFVVVVSATCWWWRYYSRDGISLCVGVVNESCAQTDLLVDTDDLAIERIQGPLAALSKIERWV